MLKSVTELRNLANQGDRKTMAVVFAHNDHVIESVKLASDMDVIKPVLIGDADKIKSLINAYGLKEPYEIVEEQDPQKASLYAMNLVNEGQCDIVMKGLIDTKIILREVVNSETGIRKSDLLSHVGVVSLPTYHKAIFATDGAMNIQPNVDQKIKLIENAVDLAHTLGYKKPKVGIISSVEKVNPKIQSTLEAKEIVEHYQNQSHDFIIDGPFALDNLVSMESKKQKGIESEVAGDCDIFVFPNLDGGNIFYKTCMFLAKGESAGIVLGAKVPIIVTSRADTANAKFNSILLAVVNAHGLSNSSN